jgi:hypothetical protein
MRVLITGNMGYVGPVLTRYLRGTLKDAELIGFDTAFFGHSLTGVGLLPEAATSSPAPSPRARSRF